MYKDNGLKKLVNSDSILKGRRALVVGATGGIGEAVAWNLARRGTVVTVHGRSKSKVEALVDEIRSNNGLANPFVQEITDPALFLASLESNVAATENGAPFDVIVVAYGPFVQKTLQEHSAYDWQTVALLDLALPGMLASYALPGMISRNFGRFLFFGGTKTDTIRAYRGNAAYAAAKTGVAVLTKSIAAEGALYNVAALTVCPGIVKTEYLQGESLASANRAAQVAKGGVLLEPSWVAETALSLLDADPCLASGAIVTLDAGLTSWT